MWAVGLGGDVRYAVADDCKHCRWESGELMTRWGCAGGGARRVGRTGGARDHGLARSTSGGEGSHAAPARRSRRVAAGELVEPGPTLIDDLRCRAGYAWVSVRPLLWVSKSHDKLAVALQGRARISATACATVAGARLQPAIEPQGGRGLEAPTATRSRTHQRKVIAAQAADQPSLGGHEEEELIGNYRNGGTDYRPKGDPRRVKVHDFEDKELGKVVPYGVYDVGANAGWVSVGITSDRQSSPSPDGNG